MAVSRAADAGFAFEHMDHLLLFAEHFGAYRLRDACAKFMVLSRKRRGLLPLEVDADTQLSGSNMSIENGTGEFCGQVQRRSEEFHIARGASNHGHSECMPMVSDAKQSGDMIRKKNSHSTVGKLEKDQIIPEPYSSNCPSSGHSNDKDKNKVRTKLENLRVADNSNEKTNEFSGGTKARTEFEFEQSDSDTEISFSDRDIRSNEESGSSNGESDSRRRLSVQAAINLFESKQKDRRDSNEGTRKNGKIEIQRLSPEHENEKMGLRRCSGGSDMTMDLASQQSNDGNQAQGPLPVSQVHCSVFEQSEMQSNLQAGGPIPTTPSRVIQNPRSKHQLNEELREKANKLEAIFAMPKVRNQAVSASLGKMPMEVSTNMGMKGSWVEERMYEQPTGSSVDLDMQFLMEMVNSRVKFGDEGFSEELRGKWYELYKQKRDAKLRDMGETPKRLENEAKLKAMEQVLEKSKAQITEKRDRSVRVQAVLSGEETNDLYNEQAFNKQSRKVTFRNPTPEATFTPPSSKDLPRVKKSFQTMPAETVTPGSIPSTKQRKQPTVAKNHLARSVPNFADLRKENTKPSAGRIGFGFNSIHQKLGAAACGQSKSKKTSPVELNRSRSANSMDEKKWCSKVMRKSCATMSELKSLSDPKHEGSVLTPVKASKVNNKSTLVENKPFLRKGRGIGPGAGPGIAKIKDSPSKNIEDYRNGEKTGNNTKPPSYVPDGVREGNDSWIDTSDASLYSDALQYDSEVKAGLSKTPEWSSYKKPSSSTGFGHEIHGEDMQRPYRDGDAVKSDLGNAPQQSQKGSPRGLKRLLSFGRKSRNFETVENGESREDFQLKGRVLFNESDEFGGAKSDQITMQCVGTCIPAPPPNFQLREEHMAGGPSLLKAPRSCFALSSFKTKGSDSKSRTMAVHNV
eukprot:Gb_19645 [translate_table: standard]